ncbi:hypothetical protein [Pantoea stewartii]|uniref:hypothetical protein n=1 Tax=Pantoea stewartii TaxID=66269 RepID=UPI00336895D0
MIENLIICTLIFAAAVYVYRDARKHNIELASRWGVGVAVVWILVLPLYLFKRKKLIKEAQQDASDTDLSGNEKSKSPIAIFSLMFICSFLVFFVGFFKGDLPGCSSPEVTDVVSKLLHTRDFSNQAQGSYEKISEIRHCNLTMNGNVYSYTVTWYSEDKDNFLVKFTQ